ncbi:hypothetical protein BDC45DRAFT_541080 [Circinella umbellata]|nr:hypothetical protein BDC45DRAFT_541080 [Circinella umbellata]
MNNTIIASNIQPMNLIAQKEQRLNGQSFTLFPLEITINIFLYLNQNECLTAMSVCREWYQNVPQYSKTLVEIFTGIGRNLTSSGRQQFLDSLYHLASNQLTHLKIMHCNNSKITLLDILYACPKLTHFTYTAPGYKTNGCSINNYYMRGKPPDLLMKHLLLSAPKATNNVVFNNIKYLHIDALTTDRHVLRVLFQKCPNLQYYIGASYETCSIWNNYSSLSVPYSLSFDDAACWCPNLKYYMTNGAYHDKGMFNYPIDDCTIPVHKNYCYNKSITNGDSNNKTALTSATMSTTITNHTNKSNDGLSLYHITMCDGFFRNDNQYYARSFVTENQQTLESLFFTESLEHYWPTIPLINHTLWFQSIQQMPRLHTMIWRYMRHSTILSIFSILLKRCPCLAYLELEVPIPVEEQTIDTSTFEAVKPFPTIRSLYIRGFRFQSHDSIVNFLKLFPGLDTLRIYCTYLPTNRSNSCLSNVSKTLTCLELYNIFDPSFKTSIFYNNGDSDSGSKAYISLLTRQGPYLKHLRLYSIPQVIYSLFRRNIISCMYALETLDIDVNRYDDVEWYMLKQLVAHKIPINKLILRGIHNYQLNKNFFKTMNKLPFLKEFGVNPLFFPHCEKDIKRLTILHLLSTNKKLITVGFYLQEEDALTNDEQLVSFIHRFMAEQKILNKGDYDVTIKGTNSHRDQNTFDTVPSRYISVSKKLILEQYSHLL